MRSVADREWSIDAQKFMCYELSRAIRNGLGNHKSLKRAKKGGTEKPFESIQESELISLLDSLFRSCIKGMGGSVVYSHLSNAVRMINSAIEGCELTKVKRRKVHNAWKAVLRSMLTPLDEHIRSLFSYALAASMLIKDPPLRQRALTNLARAESEFDLKSARYALSYIANSSDRLTIASQLHRPLFTRQPVGCCFQQAIDCARRNAFEINALLDNSHVSSRSTLNILDSLDDVTSPSQKVVYLIHLAKVLLNDKKDLLQDPIPLAKKNTKISKIRSWWKRVITLIQAKLNQY